MTEKICLRCSTKHQEHFIYCKYCGASLPVVERSSVQRYTTLLFDADNTLLNFTLDERRAIEATCKAFDIPFSEEVGLLYSAINDALWKQLEKGEVTRDEIKIRRFERFLAETGSDAGTESVALRYMQELSLGGALIDGVKTAIELLAGHYDLYIVTNGTAWIQKKRLSSSGIEKYFSAAFISEEVGASKPDKAYFNYVFDRIPEKDRGKICIIGDSLTSDIIGGINAGIDTCYLSKDGNSQEVTPTYTANSFYDILKIFRV